jgi:nicotinamidase-related amidase
MFNLFIVDPQNDFCSPMGSLYVPNAEKDVAKISDLINEVGENINNIYISMDMHNILNIWNKEFWIDECNYKHPQEFTTITLQDVLEEKWKVINSDYKNKCIESLSINDITIWSRHCEIGTWGNSIFEPLYNALYKWTEIRKKNIIYLFKGQNHFQEQYSAFGKTGGVLTTQNENIITSMLSIPTLICGEASSHCVLHTIDDIVLQYTMHRNSKQLYPIIFLKDCSSPVYGFEYTEKQYLEYEQNNLIQIDNSYNFM